MKRNSIAVRNAKNIRGQGMSEYLIIVGLIAVAGIGVMGLFGSSVQNQLGGMASAIGGGGQQSAGQQAAATAGNQAQTTASSSNNSLSTWDDNVR